MKPTRKHTGLYHWEDPSGNTWIIYQCLPSVYWRYRRADHLVSSAAFVSMREAILDLRARATPQGEQNHE